MQRCIEQRPPGGQLLQPAAGLRAAAARPRALGPDLGGGAGGRRVGQLPRRRRLDGHAVRRHAGHGLDDELRQGLVADLHRQHALHRRPDLRRRVPPLPRPEVRVGRVRRRLDPGRAGDVRLAVAQRRRARRAPRVRPAAERVLPAPDLRLLLVRGAGRGRRHRRSTPTTSCSRPTTRTRRASTPGPRTPAQRPRDYAHASCSAACPTTSLRQGAARQRGRASTACRDRATPTSTLPDLGSPHLRRARRRPGAAPADRPGRAAQRVHAGHVPRHQAGRDLGRPAGRARRGVPHRHRRVVRRGRRHGRRRRGPRRPGGGVGRRPTTSRSATSSAARSSGWPRSTALCHRRRARSRPALRRDHRVGSGPVPGAGAAARHPRPVPHVAPRSRSVGLARARYLFFTAAEIDAAEAGAMGLVGEVVPHDELDDARRRGARADRAAPGRRRGRRSSATSTPGCQPPTPPSSSARSARPRWPRACSAFLEKRPPIWPR